MSSDDERAESVTYGGVVYVVRERGGPDAYVIEQDGEAIGTFDVVGGRPRVGTRGGGASIELLARVIDAYWSRRRSK